MKNKVLYILSSSATISFFLLNLCSPVEAGGAVARRQQIKKEMMQKQQQMIEQKRQEELNKTPSQEIVVESRPILQRRPLSKVVSESAQEIVGISEIWSELDISSEVWILMLDREPKLATVERFIDIYKAEGIYIRKSYDRYVNMIDAMAIDNPEMMKSPFKTVLRFVAIMEYDFDNGEDKDRLARKVLGDKIYQTNKRRLGR